MPSKDKLIRHKFNQEMGKKESLRLDFSELKDSFNHGDLTVQEYHMQCTKILRVYVMEEEVTENNFTDSTCDNYKPVKYIEEDSDEMLECCITCGWGKELHHGMD